MGCRDATVQLQQQQQQGGSGSRGLAATTAGNPVRAGDAAISSTGIHARSRQLLLSDCLSTTGASAYELHHDVLKGPTPR
jgi:hypothetical protein